MVFPPDHMLGSRRNGVNHVGMEEPFWVPHPGETVRTEPERGTTYPVTSDKLLDWYANTMGMRSARVVICWESLREQPQSASSRTFCARRYGGNSCGNYWRV